MLKFSFRCVTVWSALVLCGCASSPPPQGVSIPVSEFVNSLKCEYATFLATYKGERLNLKGWSVTGSMDLNVVTQQATAAGFGVSGLVPFQGISVDFGLANSVDRKYTTATTVNFAVTSKVANNSVCRKTAALSVDGGIGFGDWLRSLADELDQAAGGDPKFGVSELDYQLIFAVTQTINVNGGIGIAIIPLKISASSLSSRNDVQTIKIKLEPPEIVVGKDGKGNPINKPNVKMWSVPFEMKTLGPLLLPGGTK